MRLDIMTSEEVRRLPGMGGTWSWENFVDSCKEHFQMVIADESV